jgi:hypothetical protein
VRYVIIGAFAAIAQQAPIPATRDIDVTPEASPENLTRLSLALKELGALIRTEAVPEGLPFSHDAASLAAAEVWNLICADGEFDLSFRPAARQPGRRLRPRRPGRQGSARDLARRWPPDLGEHRVHRADRGVRRHRPLLLPRGPARHGHLLPHHRRRVRCRLRRPGGWEALQLVEAHLVDVVLCWRWGRAS